MAGRLTSGQEQFAGSFSRQTGLNPRVVGSWLLAEQSGGAAQGYQQRGYHNWLNIANTDSGPAGGAHSSVWRNPQSAAKASAEWLRGQGQIAKEYGAPAPGIRAILGAAGRSPMAQIQAIANSPWASSHYNGGADLRTLYGELAGQKFPAGAETSPATPGGVTLTPGQIGVQTSPGAAGVDPAALSAVLAQVKQLAGPSVLAAGAAPARPAFSAGPTLPEGSRAPAPLTPASNPQQSMAKLLEGLLSSAGPSGPESKVTSTGPTLTPEAGYLPAGHPIHANGPLAGLLQKGAMLSVKRIDEGQDGQTNPGGPIIANGHGHVVEVKSDPGGFGPSYPVVVFTSGPLAGKGPVYLGHTLAAKRAGQSFNPGEVLSRTGTHGVGNATVPGWFEIGFANTLGQGNQGQGARIAPLLR